MSYKLVLEDRLVLLVTDNFNVISREMVFKEQWLFQPEGGQRSVTLPKVSTQTRESGRVGLKVFVGHGENNH